MTEPSARPFLATIAALIVGAPALPGEAQEITLYSNDFESPNQPISASCGNSLDMAGINTCYGRPGYSFVEEFSVEIVELYDSGGKYANQGKDNGSYAVGMLGEIEDDKLALRFDVQSQQFLNVTMDVSAIDVQGCGGPFGVQTPRFRVTLLDSPSGSFDWNGKKLDEKVLEGDVPSNPWRFQWSRATVSLDASRATDGNVVVVFDLLSAGYAVFDNLKIMASRLRARSDRDNDGVDDADDNCPTRENGNQANADGDSSGDACDPAPNDPTVCGDRDGDGREDCGTSCNSQGISGCGSEVAGSGAAGRPGGRGWAGRGGSHPRDDAGVDDGEGEWNPDRAPEHDKPDSYGRRGHGDDDDADDDGWRPPRTGANAKDEDDDDVLDCSAAPHSGGSTPLTTVAVFALSTLMLVRRRRRR